MKRLPSYRIFPFLLLLLGGLLFAQVASAQVGDPEDILKTEKQKKKPRKKKAKDPDQSPRDRVWILKRKPKQTNHQPGDFGADGPAPKRDDLYRSELNGDKGMTRKQRKKGKANGTVHEGNQLAPKGSVQEPGQVYSEKNQSKKLRRRPWSGTISEGNISVKRKDIDEPGKVYNHEDRQKALKRKKLPGTNTQGNVVVKKSSVKEPGVHHSERKDKEGQQYSSYRATRHTGNNTVKTKYVREPGVHWSERKSSFAKQYKSTEGAQHQGNIRAMSKKEKTRYYGRLAEKVHQHQGDVKISKASRKMHPSVAARQAATMRSLEQKDKARNRSRRLNRIFKNKEQPAAVKGKERKPRYDKGESEIWYE